MAIDTLTRKANRRKDDSARRQRRSTYVSLVLVSLAIAGGRIAVVTSKEGDTAFLSANDRSRWCTVASLVEHGTYAIDRQVAITDPIKRNRRPWGTIDKVRHLGSDGKQHDYSSKPPLLPTLVAGVYWLVRAATGMTMTAQPIYVPRIVLALVNLPLLALFLVGTIRTIDRTCRSNWARRVAAFGCCFGTMMLPFTVSLNNHLAAAAATAVTMWIYFLAAERLDSKDPEGRDVPVWMWLLAGVSAAFAAANELPALSMLVFWAALFAWLHRRSVLPFLAGVVIVAAGFFGTNWLAHQSLRPPYAHRGNGATIAELESEAEAPDDALTVEVTRLLREHGEIGPESAVAIGPSDEQGRWVARSGEQQYALLKAAQGWTLAQWDDWYEYPGTYWKDGTRVGVDQGEPSRFVYFLHMTIGHHGIFSLTPIWLLMPGGLIAGLFYGRRDFRRFALAVLVATAVCIWFYWNRPEIDRNYGGVSVCFRWLLWFAPLWLPLIAPVMQKLAESWPGRSAVQLLLAFSVFSMATSLSSPWQSPWLYRFWQFLGWIDV